MIQVGRRSSQGRVEGVTTVVGQIDVTSLVALIVASVEGMDKIFEYH